MIARKDRSWQFGPTTVTLLVAYMLVLQGLAVIVASGARSAGSGLLANSICLTKSQSPLGGSNAPAAPSHHSDVCCVLHCSGFGPAPAADFAGDAPPPPLALASILLPSDQPAGPSPAATPPLGSRAPPASLV
jgi:hypothetical protein